MSCHLVFSLGCHFLLQVIFQTRDRIHISCNADGFFTTEPSVKPLCYLQFSPVAQSCSTLCNPVDCTMLSLPVHHQCPELTQTHVHRIGDSIQPSHPLSSPYPPAFIIPSMRVVSNESLFRIRWPKYWSFSFSISTFNKYSGMISFRMN